MNNVKRKGINPCTGCSICSVSCSNAAIVMELTPEGFYEPLIDESKCIDCGLCMSSCYKYDMEPKTPETLDMLTYSATNRDKKELNSSTSGGVAGELAKECIRQGYKVLGVAYDYDSERAITRVATNVDEIEQFKGSKYFQSYTADAFKEALLDTTEQKYAVFGTPCQIYGINKVVSCMNKRERFLLIDLFCHGCPSLNLWRKYIKHVKYRTKQEQFEKIEFRSKAYGWHEYSFTFWNHGVHYKSNRWDDPFYTLFFSKSAFAEACYNCKARSTVEYSDIRLGDFWGRRFDTNTEGVSAVVVLTPDGNRLFNCISDRFHVAKQDFQEVIRAQTYGTDHECDIQKRNRFLGDLSSNTPINGVLNNWERNLPISKRIKGQLKRAVKTLPPGFLNRIRVVVHIINDKSRVNND